MIARRLPSLQYTIFVLVGCSANPTCRVLSAIAATMQRGTRRMAGRLAQDQFSYAPANSTIVPPNFIPTHAAEKSATYSSHSAPMFKNPKRKENNTANQIK